MTTRRKKGGEGKLNLSMIEYFKYCYMIYNILWSINDKIPFIVEDDTERQMGLQRQLEDLLSILEDITLDGLYIPRIPYKTGIVSGAVSLMGVGTGVSTFKNLEPDEKKEIERLGSTKNLGSSPNNVRQLLMQVALANYSAQGDEQDELVEKWVTNWKTNIEKAGRMASFYLGEDEGEQTAYIAAKVFNNIIKGLGKYLGIDNFFENRSKYIISYNNRTRELWLVGGRLTPEGDTKLANKLNKPLTEEQPAAAGGGKRKRKSRRNKGKSNRKKSRHVKKRKSMRRAKTRKNKSRRSRRNRR